MKSLSANDRETKTGTLPGTHTSGAGTGDMCRTKSTGKSPKAQKSTTGKHVSSMVMEAMRILKDEGYFVGRLSGSDLPFDLIGVLDHTVLFVKAVRAKHPVKNAAGVARYFSGEIRKIQPLWQHDSDNFQFWVFSKVAGLLRYRVYRGGIWNESTRNGPDPGFTVREVPGPLMRTAEPVAA
jgi:hypothetical protein